MPGKIELWQHPVSGRWYITWTVNGRSYRRSTRETDYPRADKVRAAFILESGAGGEAEPEELKVETVLDSYYERHAQHLPSALQARIAIADLKAFYGDASVATVTPRTHERFIATCRKKDLADATINQRLTRLRAALKLAVRSGDLKVAPHVPILQEPPPRADALERRQVAALLRAARRDYAHVALFIRIAFYTGARLEAILQLTWARVDLRAGTVDFRLPGIVHSRKRRAITGLPERLVASLRRLKKRAKAATVIEYQGEPIKSFDRSWAIVIKRAKLPKITPHILKHTAVSQALPVVAPWIVAGMTATSLRTLQRVYGKYMVEDLKAGANAMATAAATRNRRAKPVVKKKRKRTNAKRRKARRR